MSLSGARKAKMDISIILFNRLLSLLVYTVNDLLSDDLVNMNFSQASSYFST